MKGLRYNTKIKFVKSYDQYKKGDEMLAGVLDLSLVEALINEGKAEIISGKKQAPKKTDDNKKKEAKKDDNSIKNSADSGADNDDGDQGTPTD